MEETKLLEVDLSLSSPQVIEILLNDEDSGPEDFKEILTANVNRPEILRLILDSPNVSQEIKKDAASILQLPVIFEEAPSPSSEEKKKTLVQKMQALTVGEKISLALKGGKEIRTILFKDSNKEIILNVLKNPKVTPSEAEIMAHNRNIPEEALRAIAKNREWIKEYNVTMALVNNPKTPPGLGAALVSGLKTKDIINLAKNKNVSEAVRLAARKLVQARKPH